MFVFFAWQKRDTVSMETKQLHFPNMVKEVKRHRVVTSVRDAAAAAVLWNQVPLTVTILGNK